MGSMVVVLVVDVVAGFVVLGEVGEPVGWIGW